MLGSLTEKLQGLFERLSRERKLTEENVSDAVREVRLALLEADVNYGVTKSLVKRLKERAVGTEVTKSVSPSQQFIKVVHDELVALMGGGESEMCLEGAPPVWMLCGLQGSGKTTHVAKLALWAKKTKKREKPLLVACDLQRPAAVDQLHVLGLQAGIEVFSIKGELDPLKVARAAMAKAKSEGFDLVILDTAGRLHIDEELMDQLQKLKRELNPCEILFVANATLGQDAVTTAAEFNQRVEMTGSILTMLDGNTRGGAAISIREVTGKPLKFEGTGETLKDLQPFNPQSMADRILGMGDTINLVRKAQEVMEGANTKDLEEKMRKASFTFDDYLQQMQMMKKMGPMSKLLGMLPGANKLPDLERSDTEFKKAEAMILSMTPAERCERCEISPSRRRRIAKGSGVHVDELNKLIKSFRETKKMLKNMPNMKKMEKMFGGNPWR
jgi:signal recognition particle subunit SRP54